MKRKSNNRFGSKKKVFVKLRGRHERRRQHHTKNSMFFLSFWAAFVIFLGMTTMSTLQTTTTATTADTTIAILMQEPVMAEYNSNEMIIVPVNTKDIADTKMIALTQEEEQQVLEMSPELWNPGDVYFQDLIDNATKEPGVESQEVSTETDDIVTSEYPLGHITYEASEEDIITVARVIYCESRGEPVEGQIAVGATILNRYFSDIPMFKGKTIEQICKQRAQYCYKEISVSKLEESGCMESARRALKGEDPTRKMFPETGAMFFYNREGIKSSYQLAIRTGITEQIIGHHRFHVDFNE